MILFSVPFGADFVILGFMTPELEQLLQEVIRTSTFTVHSGSFVYAKVSGRPSFTDAFMISSDDDELTAVYEQSKADKFEVIEQNKDLRKLIELRISKPFYAIGFLAAVTKAISSKAVTTCW
jgi:hypothetical protein